jgi:hypothetical protein
MMENIVRQTRQRRDREHHIFGIDDLIVGGLIGGAAGLFGGGGGGKPKSTSTLSPAQEEVSNSLADFLLGKMNKKGERAGGLLQDAQVPDLDKSFDRIKSLLSSFYSPKSSIFKPDGAIGNALGGQPSYNVNEQTTQDYFQKSLYGPALQTFDEEIAPRIRESFAGPSSAMNSRYGSTIARTLGDITTGLNAQMAQVLQQNQQLQASLAEGARNRQTQAATLPLNLAMGYGSALAPFQQNAFAQSPAGNPFFGQALGFLNNSQLGLYQPTNPFTSTINGAMGGATDIALIQALGRMK